MHINSACWGNFSCFSCHLLTFLKKFTFKEKLSGTLSECQIVWIVDQDQYSVGPDPGPNCLQKLSADDKCCHQQGKS